MFKSPLRGIAPASTLYKSVILTDELRGHKEGAEAPNTTSIGCLVYGKLHSRVANPSNTLTRRGDSCKSPIRKVKISTVHVRTAIRYLYYNRSTVALVSYSNSGSKGITPMGDNHCIRVHWLPISHGLPRISIIMPVVAGFSATSSERR